MIVCLSNTKFINVQSGSVHVSRIFTGLDLHKTPVTGPLRVVLILVSYDILLLHSVDMRWPLIETLEI